jgi:hypothetical protein
MLNKILFVGLAVLMFACFEQGDCSDYSSNKLHLTFLKYMNKKSDTIIMDSILLEGWDSVMYKAKSVTSVTLPLNSSLDTATFHFYYDNTHALLGLKYRVNTFALSPECNAIDLIVLEEAGATVIQEIKISQASLSNNATENIKLYF